MIVTKMMEIFITKALFNIHQSLLLQLGKNLPADSNPGRPGFDRWVGKIPWRRE